MITQTIMKDEGYGPYCLVVVWIDKETMLREYSVFGDVATATKFVKVLRTNGHEVTYDIGVLATDQMKHVKPANVELSDLTTLWRLSCEYDNVEEDNSFVVFTDDNPYIKAHAHLTEKINIRIGPKTPDWHPVS